MQLLTVNQVVEQVGLSTWTIRRAIQDGELPAVKLRNRYLVDAADLLVWIDGGKVIPAPRADIAPQPPATPSLSYPVGGSFRDRLRREKAS